MIPGCWIGCNCDTCLNGVGGGVKLEQLNPRVEARGSRARIAKAHLEQKARRQRRGFPMIQEKKWESHLGVAVTSETKARVERAAKAAGLSKPDFLRALLEGVK